MVLNKKNAVCSVRSISLASLALTLFAFLQGNMLASAQHMRVCVGVSSVAIDVQKRVASAKARSRVLAKVRRRRAQGYQTVGVLVWKNYCQSKRNGFHCRAAQRMCKNR